MKPKYRATLLPLRRLISLALALYLLNFSVDSPDALPDRVQENLNQNDMESIYELVLEDILGLEQAVTEHEERDNDGGGMLDFKKAFPNTTLSAPIRSAHLCGSVLPGAYHRNLFSSDRILLDGPPPEFLTGS